MSISPIAVEFRGSRRVRTLFSGPIAASAFASLTPFAITADDGGANPLNVVAVFAIGSTPNAVEIAVDSDLTSGALYTIGFTALAAADGSTFTGTIDARVGLELKSLTNVEPERQDLDLLLYSRDVAWNGDFLEDATGDLLPISGRRNWRTAVRRRLGSAGLNWDPTYGPQSEQAVDAPSPLAPAFAGALVSQARLDDRTKQATVTLAQTASDPNGFLFQVNLIGRDGLESQTLNIPPPTQ